MSTAPLSRVDALLERLRLDRKLQLQWAWFDDHPNHPEIEAKTDVFLRALARYERACDAVEAMAENPSPCRSQ